MITNKKLVINVSEKKTRNQILDLISKTLVDQGFAKSKKPVLDGFKAREEQSTTGMQDGIAIPHVSSEAITEAKIVVVKLKQSTDWKAMDGKPTDFVIAIAVPANGRNDHFELLTSLSSKLANPEFVKEFKKYSKDNIIKTINDIKPREEKETSQKKKGAIKVVGVTTCITGVAHTFMAAQALEDEGEKRGWDVKIERQGQMTKSKLTAEDISEADYVIFGISKDIDGRERFNGKKTYTVEVAKPITKAAEVFDEMVEKATEQKGNTAGGSKTKSTGGENTGVKVGLLSHLMAGISFAIPFIAMAGIVLGLTTAFGFEVFNNGDTNYAGDTGFQPVSPFANALNTLAGQGFTLYIPMIAMFIANSISGRKAMAPAAILGLVLNIAPATIGTTSIEGFAPFFNYETLDFIGWTSSPALGFLGAIAAGYMVGFGVKYFTVLTDKVEVHAFQAIVPLLIIPIVFTVIPWFFMAFIGYLPLYGISLGLQWLVNKMIDFQVIFIAGALIGGMICFDLGGPINKIAMAIGVIMLNEGIDNNDSGMAAINGICAVAVSIPPTVLFFSNIGYRFTPLKMDEQDKVAAWTASLMGFFGITEGSIPFAAKDPKKWMPAFVVAGMVGGAVMGGLISAGYGVVDNVPMWGGPIILLAGGYGTMASESSFQAANWTWTLLYFIPLVLAGISGFLTAAGLEFAYSKKDRKSKNEEVSKEIKNKDKSLGNKTKKIKNYDKSLDVKSSKLKTKEDKIKTK